MDVLKLSIWGPVELTCGMSERRIGNLCNDPTISTMKTTVTKPMVTELIWPIAGLTF